MSGKPEILPPSYSSIASADSSPATLRTAWLRATPVQKGIAFLLSGGFVFSVLTFAVGQFFQIRGVQHMLTSRIFLGIAWLCASVLLWGIVRAIGRWRWSIPTGSLLLLLSAIILDQAFPMPRSPSIVVVHDDQIKQHENLTTDAKVSAATESLATMRAPTHEEVQAAQLEINTKEKYCKTNHAMWPLDQIMKCVNDQLEKEGRVFRAQIPAKKTQPRTTPLITMENADHVTFYGGKFKGPMDIKNSHNIDFKGTDFEPVMQAK